MKRVALILLIVFVSIALGGGIGAYLMHRNVMAQLAMSELVKDMSVLGYLESDRVEIANGFLRRQIEIHIATIERGRQFDSDENTQNMTHEWIERYAKISDSYPPMDHEYDPEIRKIVDIAMEKSR